MIYQNREVPSVSHLLNKSQLLNCVIIKDRWSSGDPLYETGDQLVTINEVNSQSQAISGLTSGKLSKLTHQVNRRRDSFSFPDAAAGDRVVSCPTI